MFRANRIGSPILYQLGAVTDAVGYTPNAAVSTGVSLPGNVINAVPALDFGQNMINAAAATSNIAAGNWHAILHQFTVTAPLAGDTVGVEVSAAIQALCDNRLTVFPVFLKLQAAAGATFGAVNSNTNNVRQIARGNTPSAAATADAKWLNLEYNQQVIYQEANATLGGTFAHGFAIINGTAAALPITQFKMQASVRQLNDQQNIGYRDTRK